MPCNDVALDVWVGTFSKDVCGPILGVLTQRAHGGSGKVVVVAVSLVCLFSVPYLAVVHLECCSFCCWGDGGVCVVFAAVLCAYVGCCFHVKFVIESPGALAFVKRWEEEGVQLGLAVPDGS